MAYKVLYRKYRPQDFNDLCGQNNIKKLLIESIKTNKIAHAYLFSGPRGTGKTSTAKLFAKTINCENAKEGIPCNKCRSCLNYEESTDIIEIDAASNNGVDEIRELRENAKILPNYSKYKIYIIDEVHMLSGSAWNAFLKILEEPPSHIIFILATTEIQKVPITILSRCQRYNFNKISPEIISENIKNISQKENIEITDEAVEYISKLADGGMRDALSFLDQLSKEETKIDINLVELTFGLITDEEINNLFVSISNKNYEEFNKIIDNYQSRGLDTNLLITKLIDYLLDIELKVIKNSCKFLSLKNIRLLSKDLIDCYNKKNAYNLIKIIIISYFAENAENNEQFIISQEIIEEEKQLEKPKSISREIILDNNMSNKTKEKENNLSSENKITSQENENLEEIIKIKINNAYVNANKELKSNFNSEWNKLIKQSQINNNMDILSIIEDVNVEVVSPTNVVFTNTSQSTTLLFNENLEIIEQQYEKIIGKKLSFICLDKKRWQEEKEKYIKNKNKKYEYIEETNRKQIEKEVYNIAKDLFDQDIIEIC